MTGVLDRKSQSGLAFRCLACAAICEIGAALLRHVAVIQMYLVTLFIVYEDGRGL